MTKKSRSGTACCKPLRDVDIFGYQVQFKYKKNQNMRQSILGGFLTIMAILIIVESFAMKLQKVNSIKETDSNIHQYDVMVEIEKI